MLLTFAFGLASAPAVHGQSKARAQAHPAAKPADAVPTGAQDHFLLQNGSVVLQQGTQIKPLSQNVRLANGTKVNYKSGIVEFPTGKITTLQEGDYVTIQGEIVFATPASAAAARGDQLQTANAKFEQYVEHGTLKSPADASTQVTTLTSKVTLLEKKVQLLNQKVTLLSTGTQPSPDTGSIDQQLQMVDQQLKQL